MTDLAAVVAAVAAWPVPPGVRIRADRRPDRGCVRVRLYREHAPAVAWTVDFPADYPVASVGGALDKLALELPPPGGGDKLAAALAAAHETFQAGVRRADRRDGCTTPI